MREEGGELGSGGSWISLGVFAGFRFAGMGVHHRFLSPHSRSFRMFFFSFVLFPNACRHDCMPFCWSLRDGIQEAEIWGMITMIIHDGFLRDAISIALISSSVIVMRDGSLCSRCTRDKVTMRWHSIFFRGFTNIYGMASTTPRGGKLMAKWVTL